MTSLYCIALPGTVGRKCNGHFDRGHFSLFQNLDSPPVLMMNDSLNRYRNVFQPPLAIEFDEVTGLHFPVSQNS